MFTQGVLTHQNFDMESSEFYAEFSIKSSSGPSQLFVHQEYYYPNGLTYSIFDVEAGRALDSTQVQASFTEEKYINFQVVDPALEGRTIGVRVSR